MTERRQTGNADMKSRSSRASGHRPTASQKTGQSAPGLKRPIDIPLLAVWIGLLTGFIEVFVWAMRKSLQDPISYMSYHMVWMSPVANVLLLAVPAVVLFLLSLGRARSTWLRAALPLFAFHGFLTLLLLYERLHWVAVVLLAAGLAYQLNRFIEKRVEQFQALVRRSLGWLVLLLLGGLAAAHGWPWWREHCAVAALPPAPADAPNVLFIVLDTVRAQSLSLYGHPKARTPQLERLARTGVVFDSALSTAPWTLPSHASLFTGRYPHQLGTGWHAPLAVTPPTLAEALSENGYLTAGFIANTGYCSYESGLDRGFAHYEDYATSIGQIMDSTALTRRAWFFFGFRQAVGYYNELGRKNGGDVSRAFLHWLDGQPRRPFFVFLNYFDAHEPYLPPPAYDVSGSKTLQEKLLIVSWWGMDKGKLSQQQVALGRRAYERCIAYLDHQIGLLFEALREREMLENTLVIITSDHGELFGEHGVFIHGNALYRQLLHVPLLLFFPSRIPASVRIKEPVSLRDLAATVLDLVGLKDKVRFPGASLARYWDKRGGGDNLADSPLLSEVAAPPPLPPDQGRSPVFRGSMKSLLDDGMHYIRNEGDGREELYDWEADPLQQHDLANSEAGGRALERLRSALEKALQDTRSSN